MKRHLLPLLIAPLLIGATAACGEEDIEADPWYVGIGAKYTYEPDEVVLSIGESGGFVSAEVTATRLPIVIAYGDGRVILQHRAGVYPQTALPDLRVRMVTEDGLRSLVELALHSGVGLEVEGFPAAADFPNTDFFVSTDQGPISTSVFAIEVDAGLTEEQIEARRDLLDFIEMMRNLPATLGDERVGPEEPYEPQSLAVVGRAWPDGNEPTEPDRDWPGPALPGQPLPQNPIIGEDDLSCVAVTSAEVPAILDGADEATRDTPWMWNGQRYTLWLRPLLPGESSCDDL
jgi:hypothetical protein